MVDLASEMAELLHALGPPPGGRGRVVQFVAATAGEGSSTVAREFARLASERTRRGVWLVELDVMSGEQYAAIAADPERYGFIGTASHASPDGSVFFAVEPPARRPDGIPFQNGPYLLAYAVGGRRWWVTRFRREALRVGQSVQILSSPDYWNALKAYADYVVIDAPAATRSRAALATAPFVDANVLVVSADNRDPSGPASLKAAIEQAGGVCAGLVLNRAAAEPPSMIKAMLP